MMPTLIVFKIKSFAGSFAGGVTDYGGFAFKPAELTPALCDDLYDNLVGELEKLLLNESTSFSPKFYL